MILALVLGQNIHFFLKKWQSELHAPIYVNISKFFNVHNIIMLMEKNKKIFFFVPSSPEYDIVTINFLIRRSKKYEILLRIIFSLSLKHNKK
jgi:hypothetical protein